MQFLKIFSYIRIQDVVDVFFLTIVTYHLYLWFRGTKALKALIGLMALGVIFTVAQTWGLFLTTWVFHILWQVLIILLIILFQPEIRQVLEKVNPFHGYDWRVSTNAAGWIDDLTEACFRMGKQGMGALLIIERNDRVDELLTGGIPIEGDPRSELLLSIFNKNSPLHDGAVIIRNGKVVSATNYLPLTSADDLPQAWGTRHRAALGLTERSDAWVLVVSEERGEVSLARDGYIGRIEEPDSLKTILTEASALGKPRKKGLLDHLRLLVTQRWTIKLGTFALVGIVWLVFAGQQDFEVTFNVPVEVENLPVQLEIIEPQKPVVSITARGLRKDASILSQRNVDIKLNLSYADQNRNTFRVTPYHITLPNDRIDIVKIKPEEITFTFSLKQGSRIDILKKIPKSN
ncbi:MAG: diadenylate cyclase CdaA [Thermodesulfobacteriota bacterium]|nr:diadenylate cyclase CdaA [Thermodesulfobacteriota bacterium]